ncbi:unnamed protein product [Ceutorhynchus assimilis]|uniref:Tesmin/TSO1-like CXC domain-containing protein n=1 Tax=Ceutorhynchus assimilis TaxID=467358 RepID=A0A9N9QRB8_9CUCU|nr:unnamed protein product [Ceutorhynchus assimilis]
MEKLLSLPRNYEYSYFKAELNGRTSFRIKSVFNEEDCVKWLNEFGDEQLVTWKILTTFPRAGRVNSYKSVWRCQHNVYPKIKMHNSNSKHTECQAKVTLFLKRYLKGSRSKDPEYHLNKDWPFFVELQPSHNHPLEAASALVHRPVSNEVKEKLLGLFHCGHSASSAREALKLELFINDVENYHVNSADGKYLPSLSKIQHFLNNEYNKQYGSKSEDNLEILKKLINEFNENDSDGKAIFGLHNNHKYVALCTPIMARVTTVKEKGILTFMDSSKKRKDGKHILLKDETSVTVHEKCRKIYNKQSYIDAALAEQSSKPSASRRSNQPLFDFKGHCLFCGKDASDQFIESHKKLNQSRREKVHEVTKLDFKQKVIDAAKTTRKSDEWSNAVVFRIENEIDLIAAEGRYHGSCCKNYFGEYVQSGTKRGRPEDEEVTAAVDYICRYLEANEDQCQFVLSDILKDYKQSLMRAMKSSGGLSRGRGITDSTLAKWVATMPTIMEVSQQVESFCGVSFCTTEQHVDARLSRITRDNSDCKKFVDWFLCHNPFPVGEYVMSLSTGVIGDENVNCHLSDQIGSSSLESIIGSNFGQVKFSRKKRVLPMRGFTSSVKLHNEVVPVDLYTIFRRISFHKKTEYELKNYFTYELAPYPPSSFDEQGMMRKSRKSVFYDLFNPVETPSNIGSALYVIDGGFLLHRVPWELRERFSSILNKYVEYVKKYFGSRSIIVFDGYPDDPGEKSTKSAERLRRNKFMAANVKFDESMLLTISKDKFLSNEGNKKRMISMLIKKFSEENISVEQAAEDADITIVRRAMENATHSECVVVVGEDIDLLGEQVIAALYAGSLLRSSSLNEIRFKLFTKSLVQNNFNLATLPATEEAARLHSMRAFLQVNLWNGHDMDPVQWGWKITKHGLLPVPSTAEQAPQELLNNTACKCSKGCRNACGCRKQGMKCSPICYNCRGASCSNTPDEIIDDTNLMDDEVKLSETDDELDELPDDEDLKVDQLIQSASTSKRSKFN